FLAGAGGRGEFRVRVEAAIDAVSPAPVDEGLGARGLGVGARTRRPAHGGALPGLLLPGLLGGAVGGLPGSPLLGELLLRLLAHPLGRLAGGALGSQLLLGRGGRALGQRQPLACLVGGALSRLQRAALAPKLRAHVL